MSERDLTSAVDTEIDAAVVTPVLLVELAFDSATVRLWNGYGDLTWNSVTWNGTGTLGTVSVIEETAALEAKGVTLQLSGIPSETLALVLGEEYQGRAARVWLAFLDSAGAVIADPLGPFGYLMDYATISEDAETSTVALQAENRLRLLDGASNRRSTDEDQRIDYPADRGYEYVASLQDKQIQW